MSNQDEKILSAAKSWKVPESRSKEEIWNALEEQITNENKPGTFRLSYRWMAAAGFVLLAASTVFLLFFQSTTILTGVAETKTVELPDGSKVTMNASSELSYVAATFDENRQLNFEGEAYFEIEPGTPFEINLEDIEVAVLGTTFNIYSRNETNEVKCLTGKVKVSDTKMSIILESGNSISARAGVLADVSTDFEISDAISWQKGKFLFTNAPLARVVNELEIQYGVNVEVSGLDGRYYTGAFDNTNLEKAVKQVFSPMGYSYEILDEKIIIK